MNRRHLEDGGKKSSARNFVTSYVVSDAYKKRRKNAGVRGDEADAANRLNNTTIEYVADTENPIDASSHFRYPTDNGYRHDVTIDTNAKWTTQGNTEAHELGHVVDTTSGGYEPESYRNLYNKQRRGVTYEYIDKQGNRVQESAENSHDRSSAEKYADLMQTRYDLYNRGIYDSTKDEPFTQEHLDAYIKALNDENNLKTNRLLQMFNGNDVIDMMNTIAARDAINERGYAKHGCRIRAEDGLTVLPELTVSPKLNLTPREKRRIARKEFVKQRLLSEIAPEVANILYYPYNVIF